MRKTTRYAAVIAGFLSAGAISATYASAAVQAQAVEQEQSVTTHDSVPISSLSSYFTAFAGSSSNAQDLINGLRSGSSITLSAGQSATVTFTPPTSTMGYGEVAISLGLAQALLTSYGITSPTPQEIQAALTGGTITTSGNTQENLTGVLTMRESGMGWGEIARKDGFNLGVIVSQIRDARGQEMSGLNRPESGAKDPDASGDSAEHEHVDTIDASVSAHPGISDAHPNVDRPDVDIERPQVDRPDIQRPDIQRPDVPDAGD